MKYKQFTFPLFLHGVDPDNPDGSKAGFVYPVLKFTTPADARAVRKAIKRFVKVVYKKNVTSTQARDIFSEGKKYMHQFMTEAATFDPTEDDIADTVMKAQQVYEKQALKAERSNTPLV